MSYSIYFKSKTKQNIATTKLEEDSNWTNSSNFYISGSHQFCTGRNKKRFLSLREWILQSTNIATSLETTPKTETYELSITKPLQRGKEQIALFDHSACAHYDIVCICTFHLHKYMTWSTETSHISAKSNFDSTCPLRIIHFDPNPITIGHLVEFPKCCKTWEFFTSFCLDNTKSIFAKSYLTPLIMSHQPWNTKTKHVWISRLDEFPCYVAGFVILCKPDRITVSLSRDLYTLKAHSRHFDSITVLVFFSHFTFHNLDWISV